MQGAVKTMVTLAKSEGKRGAAVTMLGKTVELAGHLVGPLLLLLLLLAAVPKCRRRVEWLALRRMD